MRKHLFILFTALVLMAMPSATRAQDVVQIGSGDNNIQYLPTNIYYNYSLTQQIYTAAEIGQAGTIYSVAFYSIDAEETRNLDIYMALTDKTEFSNENDWVSVTPADLVFSGDVAFFPDGWTTIELSVPFAYNGTDNLVLVVDDNTEDWSHERHFKVFSASSQAICISNDYTNYDPSNPSVLSDTLMNAKNQIRLGFAPIVCAKPASLTVSNVGPHSAKISWTGPADAYEWEYQYSTSSDFSTNTVSDFVNNPYVQLTGLVPETTYYVRVRNFCGTMGASYWVGPRSFTTTVPCPAPYDLTSSDITAQSAKMAWTGFGEEYTVQYRKTTIQFTDDFEHGLGQWTLIDADDDGYNWFVADEAYSSAVATSESYRMNHGALTPDNWLVSPQMELGNIVSFRAKGYATWSEEHFAIYVSTTGTAPADFTQVSEEFVSTSDYAEYSADLSAYVGQQGYVAIRHFNVTDMYYLSVDDFTVFATGPWQTVTTANSSVVLSGLEPETQYQVRVKSDCGGDGISGWSEELSFTTKAVNGEPLVQIGSGDNNIQYLPTNIYYNYSLTQQIYTAAEIGQAGTIYSVAFYSIDAEETRNLDIYMALTDKTEFSNDNDWISVTPADLVFSGDVAFSPGGWTTIELSVPFAYNGTDNLVLVVDDNTEDWSQERHFKVFSASSQAICIYSDNTNYDPSNLSVLSGTPMNAKNQIQLGFAPIACAKPTSLTVSNVGDAFATLSWSDPSDATAWQICVNGDETNLIDVSSASYTLAGLTPGTSYTVKVRANCGGSGETSAWTTQTFSTLSGPCLAPTNLSVSDITNTSALLSWTENGNADYWEIIIWNDNYYSIYNYSGETSFLCTDLTPGVTYNAYVGVDCGNETLWSTPITFTTTALPCPEIAGLTVTDVTPCSAELSWNANDTIIFWSVDISNTADFSGWTTEYISSPSLSFNTLLSGTTYYVRVHSDCGSTSETLSFTTPVISCPAPSGLTVTHITDNSVTLEWAENGTATEWGILRDGYSMFFGIQDNPYTFDNLDPNTEYTVQVMSVCGSCVSSDWSEPLVFTTVEFPPFFYIDGEDSICPDQTTTLTVNTNMGTDFLWSTGVTGQSITVPAGNYSVTVTRNGHEEAYGSFEVKAKQTYDISISETVCESVLPYVWNGTAYTTAGNYMQTFTAANGCDSVVTLHLTVTTSYHVSDSRTICMDELPYEWNGVTFEGNGNEFAFLQTVNGCDSVVLMTLKVNPVYSENRHESICQGESYEFFGQTLTESGDYTTTLPSVNGCDSIITLTLTVFPRPVSTEVPYTMCEGEVCHFLGQGYTTSGVYPIHLQNANGCDSVVSLVLTVNRPTNLSFTETAYDTYTWTSGNGQTYTQSGTYYHEHQDANGCQQVDTLYLTVYHPSYHWFAATACESYEWDGRTYTESGVYEWTYQNQLGADSVVTLYLTIQHGTYNAETVAVCESHEWHGTTHTTSGTYLYEYTNGDGCPSVDTLHLTVNHATAGIDTQVACESFLWIDGNTYTASTNTPTVTLTNDNGCDSVVTLHLTVNKPAHQSYPVTAYDSYTWTGGNGQTYTVSGTYYYNHQDANGCQQVDTLFLTVYHASHHSFIATACESYEWDGRTYTESGDYVWTYQDQHGADSVVTMHLTVNYGAHNTAMMTACGSFVWHDSTYTTSGTYLYEYTNPLGCPSVDTLYLTVNPAYNTPIEATICQGTSYYFFGQSLAHPGEYQHTLYTVNGCDSVITLTLNVNPSYFLDVYDTICEGESYDFFGQMITMGGGYFHHGQTVNGCDSVVSLNLTVKPLSTSDTFAVACDSFAWKGTTYTQTGVYHAYYTNAAGCDSVVNLHLTINPTRHNLLEPFICQGESYDFFGQSLTEDGTYHHTLSAVNGCDSVVTLLLHVTPSYNITLYDTICEGESHEFFEEFLTETGEYTHHGQTDYGCDSIVTLHLTVNPAYSVYQSRTICQNELPYEWNGVVFESNGYEEVHLQTVNGCDSVVHMLISVKPTYIAHDVVNICQGESYDFFGQTLTESGEYTDTLQSIYDCDSIVTLTLTVFPRPDSTEVPYTMCEGEVCYFHGQSFTSTGLYPIHLQNANGCDSVVTLVLTVNPTSTTDTSAVACESFVWKGTAYTQSGDYAVHYTTAAGCDSVVTLHLTVNHADFTEFAETVCNEFVWNGVTYTTSGNYTQTFVNVSGCDSVVTLNLTVNQLASGTDVQTACGSFTWIDGITYTESNSTATYTLTNAAGCDSVVTLNLTINPTYNVTDTRSVCPSEMPYTWNGVTFNAAGAQTVTLQTANGCDSVVTMLLTVNQTHVVTDSRSICQSELPYTWNGVTFNAAGVQTATLTDANGCDSTVIMTLTANPTYNVTLTQAVCESELPYTWNGLVFTAAGSQSLNLQATSGCDSIVTMMLTVNYGTHNVETETVCESYEWHGVTYTTSGTYTYEYTNATGCASVDTLHLTVNHAVSSEFTVETSDSCYSWNGHLYCESGDYTQTLSAANGCDSVVTLHLTITVGIDDHNDFAFKLYPNPTNGIVNVQFTMDNGQAGAMEFHVFDAYGKLVDVVSADTHGSSAQTAQIDLSGFANGVYFVKTVANGDVVAVKKVVKR